jgi:hypothetical protein
MVDDDATQGQGDGQEVDQADHEWTIQTVAAMDPVQLVQ